MEESIDAYERSAFIRKIKTWKTQQKKLKIAFLDIDATMTGSAKSTNATRKKLEELGYIVAYVTSRTEEMLMSEKAYTESLAHGFSRPQPLLGIKNDTHFYVPPEAFEPAGILDPDIIAGSTGTQVLIKQKDGSYRKDDEYHQGFMQTSAAWRNDTLSVIEEFNRENKRAFLAPYENSENYDKRTANIYPPLYRVVLYFQSTKHKIEFRAFIRNHPNVNIRMSDDSNPSKERQVLCLTPKKASKRKAVDHIIDKICHLAEVQRKDLNVLIAGDSLPDLDMGLQGAKGTNVTFLLVGGSRLTHALICMKQHNEILDEQTNMLKSFLCALKPAGHYSFSEQSKMLREIIIGDEAYGGKKAAESILSFLPKEKN